MSLETILSRARPRWWNQAACRTPNVQAQIAAGTVSFFPERGRAAARARNICADCPVRSECLDDALAQGQWLQGIFGGFSRSQRNQLRSRAS